MQKTTKNSSCPLEPLSDHLIVKRKRLQKSAGGIVLPDAVTKGRFACRGEIIAVGPGERNDDGTHLTLPLDPGDTVLFSNQAGLELGEELRQELETDTTGDGAKDVIMLRLHDIICKVKTTK